VSCVSISILTRHICNNFPFTINLFKDDYRDSAAKRKKAYSKITAFINTPEVKNNDYYKDLQSVIKLDAISGYELRQINKLTKGEMYNLPYLIPQSFLDNILNQASKRDNTVESIILAEELRGDVIK
jgi:hypothetical protein